MGETAGALSKKERDTHMKDKHTLPSTLELGLVRTTKKMVVMIKKEKLKSGERLTVSLADAGTKKRKREVESEKRKKEVR